MQYSNGNIQKYILGLLPQIDPQDKIIRVEKKSEYSFTYIFKAKNQFIGPEAKLSLSFRIPVYHDPVSRYSESDHDSQLKYKYLPIEVSNRLAYRTPFTLPYFSEFSEPLELPGVTLNYSSALLTTPDINYSEPGFDQIGAEVTQKYSVKEIEVNSKIIHETEEKIKAWGSNRWAPAVLFRIPETTTGHPEVPAYQWDGSLSIFSTRQVNSLNTSFTGSETGLYFYKNRKFSTYFNWKPFRIGLTNMNANKANNYYYFTKYELATAANLHFPIVTPGRWKFLLFVDYEIAPGIGYINASIPGAENGFSYSYLESRLKFGFEAPTSVFQAAFSLDIFSTNYTTSNGLKNDTGLLCVISW